MAIRFLTVWAAFLFLPQLTSAQCSYKLILRDNGSDGWDGDTLRFSVNGNTQSLTLDATQGSELTLEQLVQPGDNIRLEYVSVGTSKIEEVAFYLYDASNLELFSVIAPANGLLFQSVATCPNCLLPNNVTEENIYDKRVRLRWSPANGAVNPVGWWVIYGFGGLVPAPGIGDTLYVTIPRVNITGLLPNTDYTYYVVQDCGNGETSGKSGPHNFTTYWSNDVSVTALLSPQSDCELGVEDVEFAMSNPGSNPQSLIPYNFFINGQPGGVQQPEDGYYTGVIGKDSTEAILFETSYDFSEKGEYEIMVFTQMVGDEDMSNDTLRYYVNNILAAPYAQSFEKWNGGWSIVDDPNSTGTPSWEYGKPNADHISASGDGQRAWVTNLKGRANAGETSYIQSTCFDFSNFTSNEKVALEFLINRSMADANEGAFMQYSTNGGSAWVRIGLPPNTGANWYNGPDPQSGTPGLAWVGESNGWELAHHLVDGIAGQENVLFRIGYTNNISTPGEGVGIDQFKVFKALDKDLASIRVSTLGDNSKCGLADDRVSLRIVNVGGTNIAADYKAFYSVNGVPIGELTNNNVGLSPDENVILTFPQGFDSRDKVSVIRCWFTSPGDQNLSNDTLTYIVDYRAFELPYAENFNTSIAFPANWEIPAAAQVTFGHNNLTRVLAYHLFDFNPEFTYEMPRHGLVGVNDSLQFDYRIVDFSTNNPATVLGSGDKFEILISDDCGQTFQILDSIDALNHIPSVQLATRKYPLANYTGENIIIQFRGTWASGNYWFDLDNIGLLACGANMGLTANVKATSPNILNGSATVNIGNGNPPYQYLWSTGATTQTANGLAVGSYTVTVKDAFGCSDTLVVNIDVSGTDELQGLTTLMLRPNPTTGLLYLDINSNQAVELQAELLNLLGQRVWSTTPGQVESLNETIDLQDQPSGMYLMRVMADGRSVTRKVMLSK